MDTQTDYEPIFSYEESYGCTLGTHAKDKDGIVAIMMVCEIVAYCKNRGITLYDYIQEIYKKYGYYKEIQYSLTLPGADGKEKIAELMAKVRNNLPKEVGEIIVEKVRDIMLQKEWIMKYEKSIDYNELPKSNVLYFELEDENWFCVRPSGTEPKIKFYIGTKGENETECQEKIDKILEWIKKISE
jgi:phosphoglucomutase